jgi:hypothetical protein
MKDSNQAMNILEAYDLYQSYNQAARKCQCSPNTVRSLVTARREGTLATRGEREPRASLFEAHHLLLVTSLVEESKGQIRADVIHRRLVASVLTPRSTPTERLVLMVGEESSTSTAKLTNHWSVRLDTVAESMRPSKRNGSDMRTYPSFGIRTRLGSTPKVPLDKEKESQMPFFLNFGYRPLPLKKLSNDDPKSISASWGAHLVTSIIHGNGSRLMLLSSHRSKYWLGARTEGSAL